MSSENQDIQPSTVVPQPVIVGDNTTKLKTIVIYSALGLLLVGGTIFVVKKVTRNVLSNTEEKKSLDPDSSATQAKQLKMAFDNDGWWGTDEEQIRKVLRACPDKKTFKEIAASYKRNYGSPLTADMQDELTSSEYEEMMMIIAAKPEVFKKGDPVTYNYLAWAKRIRSAVSVYYGIFPGTDEEAIKAVYLELPSKAALSKVKAAYKSEYEDDMQDDLEGDLSSYYLSELEAIMKKKPKT